MRVNLKQVILLIVGVFIIKIAILDPMREGQKQNRHPSSHGGITQEK